MTDIITSISLGIGFMVVVCIVLLAIYTFLIFPNFDEFMKGVHWYKYDSNSQHILYWLGFWTIVLFSGTRVKAK